MGTASCSPTSTMVTPHDQLHSACMVECMLTAPMHPQQMGKLRLAPVSDVPRLHLQDGVTCSKHLTPGGRLAGCLQPNIT